MGPTLKVIGAAITFAAALAALFVLWTMRNREDSFARSTRYNMLGTMSLCAIVPARLVLEQRLSVVPWFLLLITLLGGGIYFLLKARRFDR